jgi:hypothetical protein
MASSSSQNNLDLNVVPGVQPEIWRPSFLSQKGPLMTNDSVMLDDAIAASVANGIITPRDEKYWQIGLMPKPLMTPWHSVFRVLLLLQI